jgi:hypothetical protein
MQMETFFVFDSLQNLWLQDDQRSWGAFDSAAEFSSRELATDVVQREHNGVDVFIFGNRS